MEDLAIVEAKGDGELAVTEAKGDGELAVTEANGEAAEDARLAKGDGDGIVVVEGEVVDVALFAAPKVPKGEVVEEENAENPNPVCI